jgi:molybdopterin-containing oxidoreductase family iron-sulfur binding subunit
MSKTKVYWQGLDALHNTAEHQEAVQNEFPENVSTDEFLGDEKLTESSTQRRDFLKFMGFSLGAATLAACETPVTKSVPYLIKPENIIPGVPNYYASTYYDGHEFCPVMVKTREGRPIYVGANRSVKATAGSLSPRVAASVLSLYDSERSQAPMKAGEISDWSTVDSEISAELDQIAANGGAIRILCPTIISPTEKKAIAEFKAKYQSTEVVEYDTVSYSAMLDANEQSFGKRVMPDYNFERADVVVSVGADFLNDWFNADIYGVGYAKRRNPNGKMSKHYQFETNLGLAGAKADVRTTVKPSEYGKVLLGIYKGLGGDVSAAPTEYDAVIEDAVASLKDARGKSLVICGSGNTADHLVANAINDILGNLGSTIDITNPWLTRAGSDAAVSALISDMNSGNIAALLIAGCNPSYSLSNAEDFNSGLAQVGLTVSFATGMDETALGCKYLCPSNHYLESWGDYMPKAGLITTAQPTIQPLFDTRQYQESLLKWAGNDSDYYTYLKSNWGTDVFPKMGLAGHSVSTFFNTTLFNGVIANSEEKRLVEAELPVAESQTSSEVASVSGIGLDSAVSEISARTGGQWELKLYQKSGMGTGDQANNPWLQELPDPISRVTWDNYITMSITDMKAMGFSRLERGDFEADMATVTANGKSITLPVYISPGQKVGTIGIALGYGRTAAGKCGNGIGQNAFQLMSGTDLSVFDVSVSPPTGEKYEIASVQTHHTMMGRESLVKEATYTEYKGDKKAGNPDYLLYVSSGVEKKEEAEHGHDEHGHDEHGHDEHGHDSHAQEGHGESHGAMLPSKKVNLWEDHPVENVGHRWGMTIDLNSCTGCAACVIACHAENNVPVVGKEEVRRSRDMHWLRIDRYYSSDMTEEFAEANGVSVIDKFTAMEEAADLPQVAFQPVMCQHCNHAPCETVCPVAATTHSNEGLNQMTYNRCIGTRYCGNNCPYKVRRFNWFQYHGGSQDFSKNPANDPMGRMVLNPDVVVRDRGVMEKCSFCVQNIQAAKLKAKKEGHKVRSEDIMCACSDACSSGAISFGDLNDKESMTHKSMNEDRSYNLLEEVGVQPNVFYKTLIRNT